MTESVVEGKEETSIFQSALPIETKLERARTERNRTGQRPLSSGLSQPGTGST